MKKTVLILFVLFLICSCDLINFGPPETLKDLPSAEKVEKAKPAKTEKTEKTVATTIPVTEEVKALPLAEEPVQSSFEVVEEEKKKELEFKTVVETIGLDFDMELVSPDTIKMTCPDIVTEEQVNDFLAFAVDTRPFYFKDCTSSYSNGEITVTFGYELTQDDIAVYINLFKETFEDYVDSITPKEEPVIELDAPEIVEHTEIYSEKEPEVKEPEKDSTGVILIILAICLVGGACVCFFINLRRKVD